MATVESSIGATSAPSDVGVNQTVGAQESSSPTTQDTSLAPQSTASTPTAENVQGDQPSSDTETDPFDQLPSIDELKEQAGQGIKYADALASIKGAFDPLKTQHKELQAKFAPYEQILERFQTADDLQPIIELNDAIFGQYERDPESGQLVPAVGEAVELMFQRDSQRAGYLWAESAERQVAHPQTGQPVKLIDLALEGMRDDPTERAKALQILGGVEPSAVAPTWAPTEEQLAVIESDELRNIFRQMDYDDRENLMANDADFINKQLKREQFTQKLMEETRKAQEIQQQQERQREQYQRQEAENAGNKYVEEQFRSGFTEFANSIVERSKFIQPLTAEAAQEQNLTPEMTQAYNQQAEQINKGVGMMVATVTAALSHPDTQWVAMEFLQSLGVDGKIIQQFDQARQEFAQNARNYGELAFQGRPEGTMLTNANRAMTQMKGRGNLVAQPLMQMLSKFFEMKATSYNATLNSSPGTRPQVSGNGYDPTSATPSNLPTGKMSRAEIERLYG